MEKMATRIKNGTLRLCGTGKAFAIDLIRVFLSVGVSQITSPTDGNTRMAGNVAVGRPFHGRRDNDSMGKAFVLKLHVRT